MGRSSNAVFASSLAISLLASPGIAHANSPTQDVEKNFVWTSPSNGQATKEAIHAARFGLPHHPAWGACRVWREDPNKIVYSFKSGVKLKCGDTSWGYIHIHNRRGTELGALGAPAGLSWEDMVYWSIYYNIERPYVKFSSATTHKACRSTVLDLRNEDGRVVLSKIFKMIYVLGDGKVITITPSSRHCTQADTESKTDD